MHTSAHILSMWFTTTSRKAWSPWRLGKPAKTIAILLRMTLRMRWGDDLFFRIMYRLHDAVLCEMCIFKYVIFSRCVHDYALRMPVCVCSRECGSACKHAFLCLKISYVHRRIRVSIMQCFSFVVNTMSPDVARHKNSWRKCMPIQRHWPDPRHACTRRHRIPRALHTEKGTISNLSYFRKSRKLFLVCAFTTVAFVLIWWEV